MIDSVRATNPAAVPSIDQFWLLYALAERDAAAATDALIAAGEIRSILETMFFVIVHLWKELSLE